MSTLKVTNIQATGETASRAVSGVAAAWIRFNSSTGSPVTDGSNNVSSVTDNGTGDFTLNWSNNMANVNYTISSTGSNGAAGSTSYTLTTGDSFTTSGVQVVAFLINSSSVTRSDRKYNCASIHGDLA